MGISQVLEAYVKVAFQAYPDLSGFDVPERTTPLQQAASIARCLREQGFPVQAFYLLGTGGPFSPLLVHRADGWRLVPPDSARIVSGVPLEERREIQAGDLIVAEPPVGRTFQVIEGGLDRSYQDLPDVYVAYASPKDDPKLAERQLFGELENLLEKAGRAGRQLVFVDALALIPEETIWERTRFAGDEEAAFQEVFAALQRETEGIGRGIAPLDTHSPFWEALGRFLAAHKVPSILEALPYALWKEIVELDRQRLNVLAAQLLLAGHVDKAADLAARYSSEYYRCNVARRDIAFSGQLSELVRSQVSPPVLFTCREIDHYGFLETSLFHQGFIIHSRLLGDEPLCTLLHAPLVGQEILWNMGVVVDSRLRALRDCVKLIVGAAFRAQGVRWAAKAFAAVDQLTFEDIKTIVGDLNHSTRVLLRQKLNQDPSEQFAYLLRDRGFLPWEVDISGLEGGGG